MSMKRLTQEERDIMRKALLDVDPEQLKQAQTVATILADGEANVQDTHLALMFYYSLNENKNELKNILIELMPFD